MTHGLTQRPPAQTAAGNVHPVPRSELSARQCAAGFRTHRQSQRGKHCGLAELRRGTPRHGGVDGVSREEPCHAAELLAPTAGQDSPSCV